MGAWGTLIETNIRLCPESPAAIAVMHDEYDDVLMTFLTVREAHGPYWIAIEGGDHVSVDMNIEQWQKLRRLADDAIAYLTPQPGRTTSEERADG